MKLNLLLNHETDSNNQSHVVIFGVSDFQLNDNGTVTVFFPTDSAFDEESVTGTVRAGLEEAAVDDRTWSELLIEATGKDDVIVVPSNRFATYDRVADDLPEDIREEITVVEPTASPAELSFNLDN